MFYKPSLKMLGVISDLDGVLWVKEELASGATEFIQIIRENSIPFCILTNDCVNSSQQRIDQLVGKGLNLDPSEMITAPHVTRKWLQENGIFKIYYLGAQSILNDLKPLMIVSNSSADSAQAVVVGDLFKDYVRADIELAARLIMKGVPLVAMQKKPTWSDGENWYIDNGFWIAAIEYVTGVKASLMGKPSSYSYQVALDCLRLPANSAAKVSMISDDVSIDLFGAKQSGLCTLYVGPSIEETPDWLDGHVEDLNGLTALTHQISESRRIR